MTGIRQWSATIRVLGNEKPGHEAKKNERDMTKSSFWDNDQVFAPFVVMVGDKEDGQMEESLYIIFSILWALRRCEYSLPGPGQ